MLIGFVALYLAASIAIGLWAARRVHNSRDYVIAGRSLPLYMSFALVFATWFGAETVLGVSATFLKDGMGGIVADPFGFSFCLVLIALFFARAFYRLNLLKAYQRLDIEAIATLRLAVATEREVEADLRAFVQGALERDARSLPFLDEVRHVAVAT
jgi:hypothetical protein